MSAKRQQRSVKCGIGVKSKIGLCMDCGHDRWAHYIAYRDRQNRLAATQLEFSVSQILKCNVPAACLRNFDRESYRTKELSDQLPGCIRLRNDLYCVEWGVKLYSLTHRTNCDEAPHPIQTILSHMRQRL